MSVVLPLTGFWVPQSDWLLGYCSLCILTALEIQMEEDKNTATLELPFSVISFHISRQLIVTDSTSVLLLKHIPMTEWQIGYIFSVVFKKLKRRLKPHVPCIRKPYASLGLLTVGWQTRPPLLSLDGSRWRRSAAGLQGLCWCKAPCTSIWVHMITEKQTDCLTAQKKGQTRNEIETPSDRSQSCFLSLPQNTLKAELISIWFTWQQANTIRSKMKKREDRIRYSTTARC